MIFTRSRSRYAKCLELRNHAKDEDALKQCRNSKAHTGLSVCCKYAAFILVFLWVGVSTAADIPSPSETSSLSQINAAAGISTAVNTPPLTLTTLNGVTYEDVSVTQFGKNFIFIKHKDGITKLYHQELPAGALDRLIKEINTKRQQMEEQIRFESEQKAKGFVKYQGQWITQVQKAEIDQKERDKELSELRAKERERRYIAIADDFVIKKGLRQALFRVFQLLPYGALCSMGYWDESVQTYMFAGQIFYLVGVNKKLAADGDIYYQDLFWAGTYTYTTVQGKTSTVNCYSFSRDTARLAVRFKLELFDKTDEPRAKSTPPAEPRNEDAGNWRFSTGSGFIVSKDGLLVTCNHVIRNAAWIAACVDQKPYPARVLAQDPDNDLALLKINGKFTPAAFTTETTAKLGQTVFAVGFPLPQLQGYSPKVTKGVISGINGMQDNTHEYQIDASVQPGNSGGPLVDEHGNIVGAVVSRLKDNVVMRDTGLIPQNVNYAIKKSYILRLIGSRLSTTKHSLGESESKSIPSEEAVAKVIKSTAFVVAGYATTK